MNTAVVKGILIGGLATVGITAGGMVGYQAYTQPKYAEVLAVKPVTETVKQAREECRDVAVQRKAPVKDENRIAGTVIGGVIGGKVSSKAQLTAVSVVALVFVLVNYLLTQAADRLQAAGYGKVYSVAEGVEGDTAKDGAKAGQRVVNGWKNANLPWTYKLDKAKMYFPK